MTWTLGSDRGMTWRELKAEINNIDEKDLDKQAQIKSVYETFHAYLYKSEYNKEWAIWVELRPNKTESVQFNKNDPFEQNFEKFKKLLTDISFYVETDKDFKLTVFEFKP